MVGALGGLQSIVLVWGSGAPTATQLFAVLAAAALGGLALLWIAFDSRFAQTPLAWVVGLALVLRLIALPAPFAPTRPTISPDWIDSDTP